MKITPKTPPGDYPLWLVANLLDHLGLEVQAQVRPLLNVPEDTYASRLPEQYRDGTVVLTPTPEPEPEPPRPGDLRIAEGGLVEVYTASGHWARPEPDGRGLVVYLGVGEVEGSYRSHVMAPDTYLSLDSPRVRLYWTGSLLRVLPEDDDPLVHLPGFRMRSEDVPATGDPIYWRGGEPGRVGVFDGERLLDNKGVPIDAPGGLVERLEAEQGDKSDDAREEHGYHGYQPYDGPEKARRGTCKVCGGAMSRVTHATPAQVGSLAVLSCSRSDAHEQHRWQPDGFAYEPLCPGLASTWR